MIKEEEKNENPTINISIEEAKKTESEYTIERIVADCVMNGKTQYLIKWKNFPHTNNSWEEESNIDPEFVQQYLKDKAEQKSIREYYPKNCIPPKSIIDVHRKNKKVYYVIRNEGENKNVEIEAKDFHKIDILKCIDFLEQKKTFKQRKTTGGYK